MASRRDLSEGQNFRGPDSSRRIPSSTGRSLGNWEDSALKILFEVVGWHSRNHPPNQESFDVPDRLDHFILGVLGSVQQVKEMKEYRIRGRRGPGLESDECNPDGRALLSGRF